MIPIHPIPKRKQVSEDQQKHKQNTHMIILSVLTEGIPSSCFILWISLLEFFSFFISADKNVLISQAS